MACHGALASPAIQQSCACGGTLHLDAHGRAESGKKGESGESLKTHRRGKRGEGADRRNPLRIAYLGGCTTLRGNTAKVRADRHRPCKPPLAGSNERSACCALGEI